MQDLRCLPTDIEVGLSPRLPPTGRLAGELQSAQSSVPDCSMEMISYSTSVACAIESKFHLLWSGCPVEVWAQLAEEVAAEMRS